MRNVTHKSCHHPGVVVRYRDTRTADFASGKRVKALPGIERPARRKLDRVEAAVALQDLAALPGNRFEALKGDRKGQYSIRINDRWRICFEWPKKSRRDQPTSRLSVTTSLRQGE